MFDCVQLTVLTPANPIYQLSLGLATPAPADPDATLTDELKRRHFGPTPFLRGHLCYLPCKRRGGNLVSAPVTFPLPATAVVLLAPQPPSPLASWLAPLPSFPSLPLPPPLDLSLPILRQNLGVCEEPASSDSMAPAGRLVDRVLLAFHVRSQQFGADAQLALSTAS